MEEKLRHEVARAASAHLPRLVEPIRVSNEDIGAMRAAFKARYDDQVPATEVLMMVANVGYRMALRDLGNNP